ncbi:MAG TPA: NAD-dependent epimerase/dehydratase family protein [Bacteroidota bacterium]|nr:NAD-dependent epimerase/dehydratase family protein [Bacteroidota bacterium]
MNILITGATGFIGSHLAERLHARGHSLRAIVRKSSDKKWIARLPVDYREGEYTDGDFLRKAVADAEMIYHVAGVTKAKTREGYMTGNHAVTRNLIEAVLAAKGHLRRFVHVSSGAAVGPAAPGAPVDETTPFHPITTYGRSKMEAEKECLTAMGKIPVTIVRPPAVYGPRDTDVFEFFKTMGMGIQPLIGFREKLVSLIHVSDLIDGIILAGEHGKSAGQTYFISSGKCYDWRGVGDVTAAVMGRKPFRVRIPEWCVYAIGAAAQFLAMFGSKPAVLNLEKARDIVQDAWTFDGSKAERELGFREKLTLEEGVRSTLAWYRAEGWLK